MALVYVKTHETKVLPSVARGPHLAVRLLLAFALALFFAMGLTPSAALAASTTKPGTVEVLDTADIVNDDQLKTELENIDFGPQVDIVALTVDTGSRADRALNDYVRNQTLDAHKEWRNPNDPDKYRDGLMILAVDPVNRKVGFYSGDNIALSSDQQLQIQEAAKDYFRANRWRDGLAAMGRTAADIYADGTLGGGSINGDGIYVPQPQTWVQKNAGTLAGTGAVAVIGGGVTAVAISYSRKRSREATNLYMRARSEYAAVSLKLPEMDINAGTLPADSTYATTVRSEVARFDAAYRDATHALDAVGASAKNGRIPASKLKEMEALAKMTGAATALESEIEAANAILNMNPGWERYWNREVGPLLASVEDVPGLIMQSPRTADSYTAVELRKAATQIQSDAPRLQQDLAGRRITPDAALAHLDALATQLEAAQRNHVDAMIGMHARTEYQRQEMRRRMDSSSFNVGGTSFFGYSYGGGISSAASAVTPTAALITGYTVAATAPTSAPSSGGSSGGYSGGSFSGSGSSSSF